VAFMLMVTGGEQWNNVYRLPSSQQFESLLLSQFPDFLGRYLLARQTPKLGRSANTMWEIESATRRKIAMVARALIAATLDTKHSRIIDPPLDCCYTSFIYVSLIAYG
jgi:hypothetical protein